MGGACGTYEKGNPWMVLVRETEGKRPLGRCRRRWGRNSKVGLIYDKRSWHGLSWLNDREEWRAVVIAVMKLLFP